MPTEWSRITINVSPSLAEEIRTAAKAERRSVASWVALLLERELSRESLPLVAEEQAKYGANETAPRVATPAHLRPHEKTVVAKKKVG